jgi:hypothetical protein
MLHGQGAWQPQLASAVRANHPLQWKAAITVQRSINWQAVLMPSVKLQAMKATTSHWRAPVSRLSILPRLRTACHQAMHNLAVCLCCCQKCPFEAIMIINLPKNLEGHTTHRYGPNSFKLHR